jgi:hypothetical protein
MWISERKQTDSGQNKGNSRLPGSQKVRRTVRHPVEKIGNPQVSSSRTQNSRMSWEFAGLESKNPLEKTLGKRPCRAFVTALAEIVIHGSRLKRRGEHTTPECLGNLHGTNRRTTSDSSHSLTLNPTVFQCFSLVELSRGASGGQSPPLSSRTAAFARSH